MGPPKPPFPWPRTEICRDFLDEGYCDDDRCAKLHPPESYKTRQCRHYVMSGECEWGARCLFAHGEEELRKPDDPIKAVSLYPPLSRGKSGDKHSANGKHSSEAKKSSPPGKKSKQNTPPRLSKTKAPARLCQHGDFCKRKDCPFLHRTTDKHDKPASPPPDERPSTPSSAATMFDRETPSPLPPQAAAHVDATPPASPTEPVAELAVALEGVKVSEKPVGWWSKILGDL
ncbi:hypothetical protein DFJ74DRAFT_722488, partial [Hyaloraphidium curvatum]